MNCIKKFSRIVCVSLFSYQGCSAVSSLRQLIQIITFGRTCQELFSKVFRSVFQRISSPSFFLSVQATWLLYHKFSRLSTFNLNFLKTYLFFSIPEAIPCDSLFNIPLPQGEVKHFLQIITYFFVQVIDMAGASPRLPYFLFFILILYAGANTFPWSQARHEYAAPTYSHPTPPVPAWQALDSGSQACLLRLYVPCSY